MRRIQFRVNNELPPKKHGKNGSMWGNATQAKRLIALRKAAVKERGSQPCFTTGIRLTLRVHVGPQPGDDKNRGDLDNFIAGVCDGLMAAQNKPNIHSSFDEFLGSDVHPTRTAAIQNDSEVVKIDAKKFDVDGDSWYEVSLQGETG